MSNIVSPIDRPVGSFSVDSNGAARYSLVVDIPRATGHDNTPQLAFVYAQGNTNGTLGQGWSMSGLSSIVRLPPTASAPTVPRFAKDGNELFCIQGQSEVAGSQYGAKVQDWTTIEYVGPSDGFLVTDTQGRQRAYGSTTNSCLTGPNGIVQWCLTTDTDRFGNCTTYNYTTTPRTLISQTAQSVNALLIDSIAYTSNAAQKLVANRIIDFFYQPRTDSVISFQFGLQTTLCHTLATLRTSVVVSAPSAPIIVKEYKLAYYNSTATLATQLQSITETDGHGNQLNPTTFTYSDIDDTVPFFSAPSQFDALDDSSASTNYQLIPASIANSGKSDFVLVRYDPQTALFSLKSYVAQQSTTSPNQLTWTAGAISDTVNIPASEDSNSAPFTLLQTDLDGSGLTDFFIPVNNGGTLSFYVLRADSQSFTPIPCAAQVYDTTGPTPAVYYSGAQYFAIDCDGKGRAGIVEVHTDPDTNAIGFRAWQSLFDQQNSSGNLAPAYASTTDDGDYGTLSWLVMDTTGNSAQDLVRVWHEAPEDGNSLYATSYAASVTTNGIALTKTKETLLLTRDVDTDWTKFTILPLDINNDSISDIAVCQGQQETDDQGTYLYLQYYIFLGDGLGGYVNPQTQTNFKVYGESVPKGQSYFDVIDVDGAGFPSIVYRYQEQSDQNQTWKAIIGKGSTTAQLGVTMNPINILAPDDDYQDAYSLSAADLHGRGTASYAPWYTDPSTGSIMTCPAYNNRQRPHMLTNIADPLGLQTVIGYKPLSDPTVYRSTASPVYPNTGAIHSASRTLPAQSPQISIYGSAFYVVSNITKQNDPTRNPIPYSSSVSKLYENGMIELDGAGWLGFQSVVDVDEDLNSITLKSYMQNPSSPGLLQTEQILAITSPNTDLWTQFDSATLFKTSSTDYTITQISSLPSPRYTVSKLSESQQTYDGADLAREIGVDFVVDGSGNITQESSYEVDLTQSTHTKKYTVYKLHTYGNLGVVQNLLMASKMTTNASNNLMDTFQDGDCSLSTISYHPDSQLVWKCSDWASSNKDWEVRVSTWDNFGNAITMTDPMSMVETHTFDPVFNTFIVQTTKQYQSQTFTKYSFWDLRFGQSVGSIDQNGLPTYATIDTFGRTLSTCVPADLSSVSTIQVSPQNFFDSTIVAGAQYSAIGQMSNLQANTMDSAGLSSSTTQFFSSNASDCTTSTSYYDCLGRLCVQKSSFDSTRENYVFEQFDNNGNKVSESSPTLLPTGLSLTEALQQQPTPDKCTFTDFDVLGRPTTRLSPPSEEGNPFAVTTNIYTHGGDTVVSTVVERAAGKPDNQLSQITSTFRFYGTQSKLATIQAENKPATVFQYDQMGNLLTAQDPTGRIETKTYDSLGRVLTVDNIYRNPTKSPNLASTNTFDLGGRLSSTKNVMAQSNNFTYDGFGRLQTETGFDGRTIQYTYDYGPFAQGRLYSVSVTEPNSASIQSEYKYTYDSRGRIESVGLQIEGNNYSTSYGYDYQNRIISKTLPDSTSQVVTRVGALITDVTMSNTGWNLDAQYPLEYYNAFGNSTSWKLSGLANFSGNADFNLYGAPTTLATVAPNNTQATASYTYDTLNRIVTQQQDSDSSTYGYTLDRLSSWNQTSFTYNDSGDLQQRGTWDYAYGEQTASVSENGNQIASVQYDNCGRMASRTYNGKTFTFAYDCKEQISSMTTSGQSTTYTSDHHGRRLMRQDPDGTKTIFVSADYTVTIAPNQSQTSKRTMMGPSGYIIDVTTVAGSASPSLQVYTVDHKGNVVAIFDQQGTKTSVTYDAFGLPTFSTTTSTNDIDKPTYEGNRIDLATGLIDFGARWYDPIMGRFCTPDDQWSSSHINARDLLNGYVFECNDPINNSDPTGHSLSDMIGGIILSAVLMAVAGVVIVATGGAAAPIAAIAVGALIGGGVGGISFSVAHKNASSGKFWGGLFASIAVNAAIGGATGGASAAIGAVVAPIEDTALTLVGTGVRALLQASVGSGSAVLSQLSSNGINRNIMGDKSTKLTDNLASSAVVGFFFGGLSSVGGDFATAKTNTDTIFNAIKPRAFVQATSLQQAERLVTDTGAVSTELEDFAEPAHLTPEQSAAQRQAVFTRNQRYAGYLATFKFRRAALRATIAVGGWKIPKAILAFKKPDFLVDMQN